jgi:hypothetical protein
MCHAVILQAGAGTVGTVPSTVQETAMATEIDAPTDAEQYELGCIVDALHDMGYPAGRATEIPFNRIFEVRP